MPRSHILLLALVGAIALTAGCTRMLRPDVAMPIDPPDPQPVAHQEKLDKIAKGKQDPPEHIASKSSPPVVSESTGRDEALVEPQPSFTSTDTAGMDVTPPEPLSPPPSVDDPPVPVPPATGGPLEAIKVAPARDEPLIEALRAVFANRHEEALRHLKAYSAQNEEIFLRLLPVLALMSKKPVEQFTPEESATLGGQLEQLMETLRTRSDLMIRKMSYCEWVKSFGAYKELPGDYAFLAPNRNVPGELVQVYTEISNVSSRLHEGYYTTHLSGSVEIHDRRGEKVYQRRFTCEQPVQTLTPLRDYYNTCSFYVPNNMPPGAYTLTIHVTDETLPERRRTASRSMEFRVSGLPRLPN